MRAWSRVNVVFVSEYQSPDDFVCVREARKREEREEQEFAAMRIQSMYRGRAARNKVSARKEARRAQLARIEEEEMTEAATKIQAKFRGGQARAEFQERRALARGEEEGAGDRGKGRSQRASLAPTAPRQAPKGGRPNALCNFTSASSSRRASR